MTLTEEEFCFTFQLVLTVWAMDCSPTDLLASLKILISLAILRTCMIRPTSLNMSSSSASFTVTLTASGSSWGGGARKRSR